MVSPTLHLALAEARLYGILDLGYVNASDAAHVTGEMLAGGVQVLQLRAKHAAPADLVALARQMAPLARAAGVPFLLNDVPELVEEAGADGAHVGQDDPPVARARELAGPGAIIGKSTHSPDQVRAALSEGPDYLGFGPLFATPTKPDYPAIGLEPVREAVAIASCPVFCIGGIKRENLAQVLGAGAKRVVVVSGILCAADIAGYCRELRALLHGRATY